MLRFGRDFLRQFLVFFHLVLGSGGEIEKHPNESIFASISGFFVSVFRIRQFLQHCLELLIDENGGQHRDPGNDRRFREVSPLFPRDRFRPGRARIVTAPSRVAPRHRARRHHPRHHVPVGRAPLCQEIMTPSTTAIVCIFFPVVVSGNEGKRRRRRPERTGHDI
jgi:hypothetical protein